MSFDTLLDSAGRWPQPKGISQKFCGDWRAPPILFAEEAPSPAGRIGGGIFAQKVFFLLCPTNSDRTRKVSCQHITCKQRRVGGWQPLGSWRLHHASWQLALHVIRQNGSKTFKKRLSDHTAGTARINQPAPKTQNESISRRFSIQFRTFPRRWPVKLATNRQQQTPQNKSESSLLFSSLL